MSRLRNRDQDVVLTWISNGSVAVLYVVYRREALVKIVHMLVCLRLLLLDTLEHIFDVKNLHR